jgi:hypothetical protein
MVPRLDPVPIHGIHGQSVGQERQNLQIFSAPGRTRTCDARFRNRIEPVQPVASRDVWAAQLASLVFRVIFRLGNLVSLIPKIFPGMALGRTHELMTVFVYLDRSQDQIWGLHLGHVPSAR